MAKLKKPFRFEYPLVKNTVTKSRSGSGFDVRPETVAVLEVLGTAKLDPSFSIFQRYERYNVEITAVRHQGVDITPIVEHFNRLADVEEAAVRYAATELFNLKDIGEEAA